MAGDLPPSDNKQPKLSDDRIVAIIDLGIGQSVGFSESKLSKERERVQYFYDGERPFKAHEGDSSYTSDDVWIACESMKAQLLDLFTQNARPVQFTPTGPDDIEGAKIRTDYCTHVLFDQNEGYSLLRDTIEEALKSRNGIVKAWWDIKSKWEFSEVNDVLMNEFKGWLAQHPEAEVVEKDVHADGMTFKRVRIKIKKDVSQVRVKLLAGEEFGISPMAESLDEADLKFHRHEMTVSDLLKAGFKKSDVEELQSDDRLWMAMEPEKIARFSPTDDLIGTKVLENGQNARRVVMVYECYLELDVDGTDESQLFKVTKVGDKILDKEPVDRHPFIDFCPLPRPKAFWGTNYAKRLEHVQTAKTYLTRSVVNHTLITNNPKTLVARGALANPKELMENRFGGIVNVKNINGVLPMPQSALNPYVFQAIQLLNTQKEEQTGISALSQGLNSDAISKQNSGDMVHELITISQLRTKIIARNFAEVFLRKLYTTLYRLVLENEDREKIVQLAGNWVPVDPRQWPEDNMAQVEFVLGYGEAQKEIQKIAGLGAALAQDPALAQWFTPKQHHYLATKALEASGRKDVNQILAPFSQPTQPPPNRAMEAEIGMKEADAAAKNAQAHTSVQAQQIAMQESQNQHQQAMAKLEIEKQKLQLELMKVQILHNKVVQLDTHHAGQQDLAAAKLAHEVTVDAAEIALQYDALEQQKLTATAEPHG
jgi:hypothetical protein